ncbi:MAG: flagellar hook-length control protein FliK [Campylobacterales bacterium]|nr:flagellar hook-length control protein FliK [Campylobacterales bacterium]
MISFDVKPESTPALGNKKNSKSSDKEPTLSFAELLKGAGSKKEDKVVQNGTLVLALSSEEKDAKTIKTSSKKESFLALLKNEDKAPIELKESLELNPKLASSLSATELKTLIADAKDYLKSKILSSDDYKKSEIKELPKTLKGLAEVAQKFGIDVSKITIEDVQLKKAEVKITELPHAKEIKADAPQIRETKAEVLQTKEIKLDVSQIRETKVELPQTKEEITEAPQIKEKKVKSLQSKETKIEVQNDKDILQLDKIIISEDSKVKETKTTTTLFKVNTSAEHSTEQLVHSKASGLFKTEDKATKSRADETLQQLLRGEKPSHTNIPHATDVSVVTEKVRAPSVTFEAEKSFEKLLHGDTATSSDSSKNSKVDGLTTHKADSFEVKLNEAKQMIRYLSADVKTAIEDYKSPFTRVKVQLNPESLGDVELTIVQRGKNLHVNISSNTTAINTLSMNATELKTQLSNNGINNATLNFNNNSDGSGASQQQGQKQNEKRAHEEYNYFENEENSEEVLSSLEIVVPRYI